MTPGILIPIPLPMPITSISPSRFLDSRECKLKATWGANGVNELLPSSPAAHLGTTIHRVLEIGTDTEKYYDPETLWQSCINQVEDKMRSSWMEKHFVPLRTSALNYEVKKRLCLATLQSWIAGEKGVLIGNSLKSIEHETCLETSDGRVRGYADAIYSSQDGDVIADYKTGHITEMDGVTGDQVVLERYQMQLKIYAALFYSARGRWPTSFFIIGLDGTHHTVSFTPDECLSLLGQARQALEDINRIIADMPDLEVRIMRLASPSSDHCHFCQYRPICPAYWKKRSEDNKASWPHDIRGKIEEKRVLGNGLVLLRVLSDSGGPDIVIVRGLKLERHPALTYNPTNISIFSMIPDSIPGSHREGSYTIIYSLDSKEGIA